MLGGNPDLKTTLAVVLPVGGILLTAGGIMSDIKRHDRQIGALEAVDREIIAKASKVETDVSTVRVNVEWLVRQQGGEPKK